MGISTGCRIHAWSKTIRVYLGTWYLCGAGVAVALGQCCGSFVVRAYYQGTIWTDLRRKVCKYLVDGRFSPVIVQVISFNIGDDRNIWGVVQQRTVGFIGLRDKPFTGAVIRICAKVGDGGTYSERRLGTSMGKSHGCHRRSGGLAVCAGYCEDLFAVHRGGKSLRTVINGHTGSFGGLPFRIAGTSHSGSNNDVNGAASLFLCMMEVFGLVANVNGGAAFA